MKKLLILLVATFIKHPEKYYINAIESRGIDIKKITHAEISVFVAMMKKTEAEFLIDIVFQEPNEENSKIINEVIRKFK